MLKFGAFRRSVTAQVARHLSADVVLSSDRGSVSVTTGRKRARIPLLALYEHYEVGGFSDVVDFVNRVMADVPWEDARGRLLVAYDSTPSREAVPAAKPIAPSLWGALAIATENFTLLVSQDDVERWQQSRETLWTVAETNLDARCREFGPVPTGTPAQRSHVFTGAHGGFCAVRLAFTRHVRCALIAPGRHHGIVVDDPTTEELVGLQMLAGHVFANVEADALSEFGYVVESGRAVSLFGGAQTLSKGMVQSIMPKE